jgi:hypothetical protein
VTEPASYLLVIGEREALAWILREQRMAFPAGRKASTSRLQPGDRLFMLTTRGCYHNPSRDRTLVIGVASVATQPEILATPINVAGRDFGIGCDIAIELLAPIHRGVEVAPLVHSLRAFPHKESWSATLRQTLVALPSADVRLLSSELKSTVLPGTEARGSYLDVIRPVRPQAAR